MSQQCCVTIYHNGYFHGSLCSKTATITRDGKDYCGIHDPLKVAARTNARYAKLDAERKAKQDGWAKQNRRAEAGEMAIELAKWISDAWEEGELPTSLRVRSQAVLDKLEGK